MKIEIVERNFPALEASKTASGREWLAKQREKHKIDALQPSDPLFHRVYGEKIKEQAKKRAEEAQSATAAWQERKSAKRPVSWL